jgi:hypothetical protein
VAPPCMFRAPPTMRPASPCLLGPKNGSKINRKWGPMGANGAKMSLKGGGGGATRDPEGVGGTNIDR